MVYPQYQRGDGPSIVGGTRAALGRAVAAFLVYDLLFTEPRFSLVVADTRHWWERFLYDDSGRRIEQALLGRADILVAEVLSKM